MLSSGWCVISILCLWSFPPGLLVYTLVGTEGYAKKPSVSADEPQATLQIYFNSKVMIERDSEKESRNSKEKGNERRKPE